MDEFGVKCITYVCLVGLSNECIVNEKAKVCSIKNVKMRSVSYLGLTILLFLNDDYFLLFDS